MLVGCMQHEVLNVRSQQVLKIRDWKIKDRMTGLKNAGAENAGMEREGSD